MKPLIRVTTIEAFRNYYEQSEHAPYEIDEQKAINIITSDFKGNEYTRIGTAFHRIVEEGTPICEKVPAGEREFIYYNKPTTEPVPCGRVFDVDSTKVIMDIAQIKVALEYRNQYLGAYHEVRKRKDYGNAIVTGCADMLHGIEIRDIKTKFSFPSDDDYINSCQWKYYLDIFGLDTFHYDLFIFDGYKADKHKQDVRGLELTRYTPAITCHRYEGMEHDNQVLLEEFLEWIKFRKLENYLNYV